MTRRFAVLCYGLFASGTYGHYNAPNFEPGVPTRAARVGWWVRFS
jgi:hypothetical protein